MSLDEGYDVECVREESEDLLCICCLKLMRNSVQMKCGHGTCRTCFDQLITISRSRNADVECPSCRCVVNVEQLTENKMLDRIILALKVKCQSHLDGCEWTGELSNMEIHKAHCDYRLVDCPIPECQGVVQALKLRDHLTNDCKFMERACAFKEFGCCKQVTSSSKDLHEGGASFDHVTMVRKCLQEKDEIIDQLRRENEELKRKVHAVEEIKEKFDQFETKLSSAIAVMTNEKANFSEEPNVCQAPKESLLVDDEFISEYDLVSDPTDMELIHESLQKLCLRQFTFQNIPYDKNKLIENSLKVLKSFFAKREKECNSDFFNAMQVNCDCAKLGEGYPPEYWKKLIDIFSRQLTEVFSQKNHVTHSYLNQLSYIANNEIVPCSGIVLKTSRYSYVLIRNLFRGISITFEVEKGVANTVCFSNGSIEMKVCDFDEVKICHVTDMFQFEPTKLSRENLVVDKFYKFFRSQRSVAELSGCFLREKATSLETEYAFVLRLRKSQSKQTV